MDDDGIDIGKRVPIRVRGHRQGRRDDHRPHRGVEAGARLLQFRHHHRLRLRAGRLQVHHLADRLSDQRRLVPQPQGHRAAGPRRQRDAAGADALVDDLSDDHRRHDLQGAGAGDPGPRHRRPSRRSRGVDRSTASIRSTSEFFIGSFGPLGGGWGAKRTEDGVVGTVCINDGDTHNSPNEQAEAKFPIVVERYRAGAGFRRRRPPSRRARRRARGARAHQHDGQHPERARPLPAVGPRRRARRHRQRGRAPRRRRNGRPTSPTPRCWWRSSSPATPSASAPAAAAATAIRSSGRSSRCARTCGRATCRRQSAAEHYGVVIDPETFAVDMAATEKLRAARRSSDGAAAAKSA